MCTPKGYLFSREAILENLLDQKKANKRKLAAWQAQQADDARKQVGARAGGAGAQAGRGGAAGAPGAAGAQAWALAVGWELEPGAGSAECCTHRAAHPRAPPPTG